MVNRPGKRGTERPLQNHHALLVAGFVEAARFLGGQPFAPSSTKLSHHRCPVDPTEFSHPVLSVLCSAGFSLRGLVLASTNPRKLKHVPQDELAGTQRRCYSFPRSRIRCEKRSRRRTRD